VRLSATLLATILAVLVVSGTRPTLSGMTALLPCEAAAGVSGTPKPKAPGNLRIIKGLEELVEEPLVSGPSAGPDADYYEPPAAGDTHAYYVALASRPDCFAAYSLRDDSQVVQRSTYLGPRDLAYIYPDDPDPRRQDAMRILTRADQAGPGEGLKLPVGKHYPQNLLTVEDRWWGAEMAYHNTKIAYYKGDPYFDFGGTSATHIAVKTMPQQAEQNTHTLPSGGPYVLMLGPQFINAVNKYPYPLPLRLPYNVPSKETRNYGNEGAGPRDTSAGPEGAEFGAVAERWTRIWHFFERAPEEDWDGKTAYRWFMWAADTTRGPVRILNGVVISMPTAGITHWRMHMGVGNAYTEVPAGRGPLVAYARNVVALHGTSKADVLTLLERPVN
jgi:hypothetical protein